MRRLFPNPLDQALLDLLEQGERSTERFAAALGLGGQSVQEQRAEVKRRKDRIKKKLRRYEEAGRGSE